MFKRLLMVAMLVIAPLTAVGLQISPIRIS